MKNLILWIPLLPFIGFLINGLGRKYLSKGIVSLIGSGTVLASFIISIMVSFRLDELSGSQIASNVRIITQPVVKYFDFINVGTLNIPFAFQVDQLTCVFLLIIT